MLLTTGLHIAFPLEDPLLEFLLLLAILLCTPLLLNRLKIPPLLGFIIAGALIGPHGLNLVLRDGSITLLGTAGLLYIMFLSGLEMDTSDFKRNSGHSFVFGLFTFGVPMLFGVVAGYCILGYRLTSSVLLAGLFASQTLIAYPIASKLGITRDRAVQLAVGGTIITDILALLVLTVTVGIATGQSDNAFWWRLGLSVVACVVLILLLFPWVGRRFFKRTSDPVAQYVFVLAMVFLGGVLAQVAGLEPIIGAFLAGLAMNRLIPHTSPLMNRIEFVGNTLFIPFFLIGVGMLIDYRAVFRSWETLEVASVMILLVTAAKYLAAYLTQKSFGLTRDQRTLLFGLSSAHVAATLAAVMVGYNVILGVGADGEPVRLLSEGVLNGTILMILATCTVSMFATQRGAHNIALNGSRQEARRRTAGEHVLIPVSHDTAVADTVGMSIALTKQKFRNIYVLNAIDNRQEDPEVQKSAQQLLDTAASAAAAAGIHAQRLLRYDVNIVNAIVSIVRERNITDLVLGMHHTGERSGPLPGMRASGLLLPGTVPALGNVIPGVLAQCNVTTFIYRPVQPLSTIRRHIVLVPRRAELEAGFHVWLLRLRHLAHDTGAQLRFYAPAQTADHLRRSRRRQNDIADYIVCDESWERPEILLRDVRPDDCVWVVMSRRDRLSWQPGMGRMPAALDERLTQNSYVLIYPIQAGEHDKVFLTGTGA